MNLVSCCSRRLGPSRSATELEATLEASLDPDNIPPRSRLFLVVPKNADGAAIEVRSSKCSYLTPRKTALVRVRQFRKHRM